MVKTQKRAGTIATMYQRFLDRKALDIKRFIWRTPIQTSYGRISNLDLLPCDIDLLGEDLGSGRIRGTFPTLEALKRHANEYLRERLFLKNALKKVLSDYDYILIDCPPNLYLMTQNALIASDWYIITTIPDHLSTIGLSILRDKVKKISNLIRSAQTFSGVTISMKVAELGGVIFVKVRIGGNLITTTHFNTMREVEKLLNPTACFETYTTEMIGYSEAAENCLPVWMHTSSNAKRAANKREYEKITGEFLKRF
jgi:chromosome partitioning protein